MKKNLLLITFLSLTFCALSQNIISKWNFKSILPDSIETGIDLKDISELDTMQINNDGSFHYEIKNESLNAHGTWELTNNKLSLHYDSPKTITREYQITTKENTLILNENGINYTFIKNEDPIIMTNSVNTMNSIFRGMLGIISLLLIAFLFSRNRTAIDWSLVIKGLVIQIIFALLILKVSFIQYGFEWLSSVFVTILSFTREGSLFVFGNLIEDVNSFGFIFAFQVLPTILFFSALTSLLFYYGVLQKIVYGFALLMKKIMNLSGSESLAAAGNIFLGQTESPLLIKPYIEKMTMSELLCLMSGGMATIAGGVLAAYIGFLGGSDPQQQLFFAKHLLAASVMSAPAAVIAAKILLPETEKVNEDMSISKEQIGTNALEAISIGTTQGLKLAINVGAMLLVFIAFIAMINFFLEDFIGDITGINRFVSSITNGQYDGLTLEFVLGYTLAPLRQHPNHLLHQYCRKHQLYQQLC